MKFYFLEKRHNKTRQNYKVNQRISPLEKLNCHLFSSDGKGYYSQIFLS